MIIPILETPMSCPYFNCAGDTCQASSPATPMAGVKIMSVCAAEDYDLCPIFLAKVLRSSRPGGFGRQNRELAFK
jgi:hypothetical protein